LLGGVQPLLGCLKPRLEQSVQQRRRERGVVLDGGEQRPVSLLEDRISHGVHRGSQGESQVGLEVAAVGKGQALPGADQGEARQRRVAKALEITSPNGIVEQRFVKVGGIDQWIQIRGEDRDNPVLLILHGGPGWPNAVFTLPLRPWEQHFTVVHWDHRGAGKTLGRNGKAGSGEMTFDRRVADAVEVIDFLRQHLGVDKVIVLAESMGTLTGLPLAMRRPDLVHALVATDLYVNMAANEAAKYQLTLERLRAADNTKGVAALERIGGDPTRWDLRAPTWRGRSRPTCPPLTWTAGAVPAGAVVPDLHPAGAVHPVHGVPVVHRPHGWSAADSFVSDGRTVPL
jgi:pimeloyl-ACP methyl ester carboxylesterase